MFSSAARWTVLTATSLLLTSLLIVPATAQFGGGGLGGGGQGGVGGGGVGGGGVGGGGVGGQGGGQGGQGGGQGGGGVTNNFGNQAAGVVVDAEGVLRVQTTNDPTGQLTRQRLQAAAAALNPKLAAKSSLRKVSLQRLEKALEQHLATGRQPTEEMKCLAGLTRVKYVFFYPETGDIVVAGPAEGWAADLSGRLRGINSGRPVMELQDLVVALRAFSPSEEGGQTIGCSIDPTAEGLVRMQNFLRQIGSTARPADTQFIVQGLRTNLGLQNVRVMGVSPKTHFAQVLVEADYRMKLIGIGLEQPPVKLASYVDNANPAQVSRNALQRWYFTPDYNSVRVTDDMLGMELVGNGVKLVGEDEVVAVDGARKQAAGAGNMASKAFVTGFTQKYPELAERSPVYAQLRNLIDMSIAAAFIKQQSYHDKADWAMATFGDEGKFPVETCQAPVQVETAVTSVWRGNRLMTPVGGGVTINAEQALLSPNMLHDDDGKLTGQRQSLDLKSLPAAQWWWD